MNQIDPASLNLGAPAVGDPQARPKFSAAYLPAVDPSPAPVCALPALSDFTLTTALLVELVPSCIPTFQDTQPIPPVYNPATVRFAACESLSALTRITTCETTRNSSLTLRASGPDTDPNGGPSGCELVLEGNLCVEACSSFSADMNVAFSGAADSPESFFEIIASDQPDCGFLLRGNIDVRACAGVGVTTDVDLGDGLSGFLRVVPAATAEGEANCGVVLEGQLNLSACTSFVADQSLQLSGNALSGELYLEAASAPACGVRLAGNLRVDACKTLVGKSTVDFDGDALEGSELVVSAASAPDCGIVLGGQIKVKACKSFEATGGFKIGGAGVKTITPLTLKSASSPSCGLQLDGEIEIQACSEVLIENELTLDSSLSGGIQLESVKNKDGLPCGFKLTGDLGVNFGGGGKGSACSEVTVSTKYTAGSEASHVDSGTGLDNSGTQFAPSSIDGGSGLKSVSLDSSSAFPTGNISFRAFGKTSILAKLSTLPKILAERPKENKCGIHLSLEKENVNVDLPFLEKPLFSCQTDQESPDGFNQYTTELQLNKLGVAYIHSSECIDSTSFLDLSGGQLFLEGTAHEATLGSSNLYIHDTASGASVTISAPPSGGTAHWREIILCENGVPKTFNVLMTEGV